MNRGVGPLVLSPSKYERGSGMTKERRLPCHPEAIFPVIPRLREESGGSGPLTLSQIRRGGSPSKGRAGGPIPSPSPPVIPAPEPQSRGGGPLVLRLSKHVLSLVEGYEWGEDHALPIRHLGHLPHSPDPPAIPRPREESGGSGLLTLSPSKGRVGGFSVIPRLCEESGGVGSVRPEPVEGSRERTGWGGGNK